MFVMDARQTSERAKSYNECRTRRRFEMDDRTSRSSQCSEHPSRGTCCERCKVDPQDASSNALRSDDRREPPDVSTNAIVQTQILSGKRRANILICFHLDWTDWTMAIRQESSGGAHVTRGCPVVDDSLFKHGNTRV